jgi:acyl carrier protein
VAGPAADVPTSTGGPLGGTGPLPEKEQCPGGEFTVTCGPTRLQEDRAMTAETTAARTTHPELFAEIAGILRDVTGEDARWAARIAPESTLEGDLGLESRELVDLGERLRDRFGDRVDLLAFVGGLDIDELIDLTVADLVAHVAAA